MSDTSHSTPASVSAAQHSAPTYSSCDVTETHQNTAQEVINITADRAELILIRHKRALEDKKSWHAPLGMTLTLGVLFPTTTFKVWLGITAETWAGFFLASLFGSIIWLARNLAIALFSPSVASVVEKLKKGEKGALPPQVARKFLKTWLYTILRIG